MTRTLIVYPEEQSAGGGVCVVFPCLECGLTIDEIAKKDVPAGRPFILIDESELPDAQYREAWDADFSEPDGYGLGYDGYMEAKQREQDEARSGEGG
jgi:hypothetical protein